MAKTLDYIAALGRQFLVLALICGFSLLLVDQGASSQGLTASSATAAQAAGYCVTDPSSDSTEKPTDGMAGSSTPASEHASLLAVIPMLSLLNSGARWKSTVAATISGNGSRSHLAATAAAVTSTSLVSHSVGLRQRLVGARPSGTS